MSDLIAIICVFGMSFCAFILGFGVGIRIGWKAKEISLRKKNKYEQIYNILQPRTDEESS